jgi:hypothetical protein
MGLSRINRLSRISLILAGTVALLLLVLVACGEGDDGFRADPRSENQSSSQPDNQQNNGPGPDPDPEPELKEGELPGRDHGDRTHGIWPQVWSQHAPDVKSWEYKVNCGEASSHTDPCFLSDLTSVEVTTPTGDLIELEKDFNTNEFSGEITRRWVLYGPQDGELPEQGDYVFSYNRGDELLYEQLIPYESGVISYPTGVEWRRDGPDIAVTWSPPAEAANDMHYKALIWQVEDTPDVFISNVFDWDADTVVLKDVPMIVGGKYSLNVAIFFDDGYAYSEYIILEWPESGETGD